MSARVYISGPITGTTDHFRRFAEAEVDLRDKGFKTINPQRLGSIMPDDASHEEFMKICYPLLDLCDVIYMLDGWQQSKGAALEYAYAVEHKLAIVFQGGTLTV